MFQQGSGWNVGVATKNMRKHCLWSYLMVKCLCLAPEVTVREIYIHPEPEVLGEYNLVSNFQKTIQLTNSIKKES